MPTALDKLKAKWAEGKFVSVGLDSDIFKLPDHIANKNPWPVGADEQVEFNKQIIDATGSLVAAFKPNFAFYLWGPDGLEALRETIAYAHSRFPDVVVILDAKFGDIGNTNSPYTQFAFEFSGADALTINCYMGQVANQPFLDNPDKLIFVLCRTSNDGADEFQDRELSGMDDAQGGRVFTEVAYRVEEFWNVGNNCGLVTGATTPQEIAHVRMFAPTVPLLIPGVGAQGGELKASVLNAVTDEGGFVINSSRGIIFASSGKDFAEVAQAETYKLTQQIRFHLNERRQQ